MTRGCFVIEQHVGHQTYYQNLRRFIDDRTDVEAEWVEVTYRGKGGIVSRLPFVPGDVKGTLAGRAMVRSALARSTGEVSFFYTQSPAALAGRRARRMPYVIATDITPRQYYGMARYYGRSRAASGPLRLYKHLTYRAAFRGAFRVLPFTNWVARSLVADYGVNPERVAVLPPGVDVDRWKPSEERRSAALKILFVGGHFRRKGGDLLLEAFRTLAAGGAELHVVTRETISPAPGVTTYYDLEPNSDALVSLFQRSDVLVMPSFAEAFGHVVVEAAAAGLPAIVSKVGGMSEIIDEGKTGFVINPGDQQLLAQHLKRLAEDIGLCHQMGRAARSRAVAHFNGRAAADKVVHYLSLASKQHMKMASR